jgi:hypothetical protein
MTLLDDLQSIDLSGVIDARGSISGSINSPELQALLAGGAAQTVLGELGNTLQTLRESADHPTRLLAPLIDAMGELPLGLDNVDISQYLDAVREGGEILTRLLADFDGSAESLGRSFGMPLSDLLERAQSTLRDVTTVDLGELAQFRDLLNRVEQDGALEADALIDLITDVLIPFPNVKQGLRSVRSAVRGILDGAAAVSLPPTRTLQLVISLNGVAAAAASGNLDSVQRALNQLESARNSTRTAIEADLQDAVELIDQLGIPDGLAVVGDFNDTLRNVGPGILEFMDDLRVELAAIRGQVEDFDPARFMTLLSGLIDLAEQQARTHIAAAIDEQVERLEAWLRDLLGHLPLRQLRAEITRYINTAAQAIVDADLAQYARAVYEMLDDLDRKIDVTALTDTVQNALANLQQAIDSTLGTVVDGLGTIAAEINNLAAQAEEILGRVVAALRSVQESIDGIVDAVNNLGIELAAQQVIDSLASLRETAEELLSELPLPEPMRPLVQQVIDAVKSVDIDAAFDPIRERVAEFAIPDQVEETIVEALEKARECLNNLIPSELIASVEAELTGLLDEIRNFNPASLLGEVTGFVDQAADFIEGLDPRPHIAPLRAPFQTVLDSVDAVHPARLLAPVIEAYHDLFRQVNIAQPQATARHIGQAMGTVGESVARAAIEPVRQLSPTGTVSVIGEGPSSAPPDQPPIENPRPGDIIRLFGYLPNKLREALVALDQTTAGDIIHDLDSLMAGLAASLRRLPEALWTMDDRLATQLENLLNPLGQAQVRAQYALQANFSVSAPGVSFNLDGALQSVALAGPGPMRLALSSATNNVRGRARGAALSVGGDPGAQMDRIANLLEGARISGLLSRAEDLLAALDPEPVAQELDALMMAFINKAPEFFNVVEDELVPMIQRVKLIVEELNPGTQAHKFLSVLDVLREELDLLNPARLAAELAVVHAAVRETIAAYDPIHLADGIAEILTSIAAKLRALDPAMLLGDLSPFDNIIEQIEAARPTQALAGVGESLTQVGDQLVALNPGELLGAIEGLGPRVLDSMEAMVRSIRDELIALLESLEYFSARANVEVEARVG